MCLFNSRTANQPLIFRDPSELRSYRRLHYLTAGSAC
jgi:hypothetical protein